ncbi:MAG: PocR ligand-binding domain-containing protein [Oscillospiraceae bacterium]
MIIIPNQIELLTVLKELHNISGFRISVFDTEFKEVAAYPIEQSPFCKLIKQNEKTKLSCQENDRRAFKKVQETNTVYLYQCSFGLYDAVAPLYSFGKLTGYLMMGQTLDTLNSSPSFVISAASPYITDKKDLTDAVSKIHIRAKENIVSCLSIMAICAEYITLTNRLNSTKQDLSYEVKRYIDQNYKSKITIELLCERFFCSRTTLINTFKKTYSVTITEYLTKVRINHSISLLTMTSKTIGEIAELCGFSDQNYFSKVFFKQKGKTPSEFRRVGC